MMITYYIHNNYVIKHIIIYLQKIPIDTTYFPTQKYKILYHPTSVFWFRITILHSLPTSNYFYTGTVFG